MKHLLAVALVIGLAGSVYAAEATVTNSTPAVVEQKVVVTVDVLKAQKASLTEQLKTATKDEAVKINAKIAELDAQIKALEVK